MDKMNARFGADVFMFKYDGTKKYTNLECILKGCSNSLWFNIPGYKEGQEVNEEDLKPFKIARVINTCHVKAAHKEGLIKQKYADMFSKSKNAIER